MKNPVVLLINGPMCSGKSSVAELLLKKWPGSFRVSGDKIKWLISDYSADKYSGTGTVNRMLFKLAEAAIAENLSLIIEGNIGIMKNWRTKYADLAARNNLRFVEFNIEADFETLKKRFEERIANAEKIGGHISVRTLEGMKERYDAYVSLRDSKIKSFDSFAISPEEIALEIEQLMHQSL